MTYKFIEALGFRPEHEIEWQLHAGFSKGLMPARVSFQGRDLYKALSERGEFLLSLSGSFLHARESKLALPAVGDWVLFRESDSAGRSVGDLPRGQIVDVLRRRTMLVRKSAGDSGEAQMLAVNADAALLVSSLNQDLSPRRLERYVSLARAGRVLPIVVLTKVDLFSSDEAKIDSEVERLKKQLPMVEVLALSAVTGWGVDRLKQCLEARKTYVLLGSSGVGKSTLINLFLGSEKLQTQDIRESDAKGRHTTTARHLRLSEGGAIFLDTPGMRELQLDADHSDVDGTFEDVTLVCSRCKFSNCQHVSEPGCAVKAALASGTLDEARWQSYLKLQREVAFQERRNDKVLQSQAKNVWKKLHQGGKENAKRKRSPW